MRARGKRARPENAFREEAGEGMAANCAFGGAEKRTLFITAVSAVWAVEMGVEGR